ncbi:hypothetical protein CPB86DRAFT_542644 [Serendipita vermifera]|nr:hypothetical protein CPB86DRAFT_542644 [Serendipita vermifera]
MGEATASVGSPFTTEVSIKSDNDADSDVIPLSILRSKTEDEVSGEQDVKMEEQSTTLDEIQYLPDITPSKMSVVDTSMSSLDHVGLNELTDRLHLLEEENMGLKERNRELEERLQYYTSNYPPTSANSSSVDLLAPPRPSPPATTSADQYPGISSNPQEMRKPGSASKSPPLSEDPSKMVDSSSSCQDNQVSALLREKDAKIEKLQLLLEAKNTEILKLRKEQNLSNARNSSHREPPVRIVKGKTLHPGTTVQQY